MNIKSRLSLLMVACLIFGGLLLSRSFFIQIMPNSRLALMAKRQFQSKLLVRPRRGLILDRNGEPLAINVETQSLAANPSKVTNKRTLSRILASATSQSHDKILDRLNEKREFVWIKRQVNESELESLRKTKILSRNGDLPDGLWLVKESKRIYPQGELAAHILGDVNIDSDGIEGVELWANESLSGKVISVNAIKDALGRPAFMDAVAARDIQDGEPVELTLDTSLQYSAEQELHHAIQKSQAKAGTVMVMNATSGEILAMANYPTFNPNDKSSPLDRRRNRALTDGYEPGSTYKAILLATALSRGWKLSDRLWAEQGSMIVQGRKISEAEAHEKFEWLSLKKMIQVSSNVVAAKLALKVGVDSLYHSTLNLEFGQKTGLGFPGEISGKVPPLKNWQPITLANIGFGHGILVTPIQMLRVYASFLNGGWLVQPTLIKSGIAQLKIAPPKRVFSQKVCDQVIEALKTVTEKDGTGIKAALEGYTVAGKTGTAQMIDPHTGKYSRSRYISSFVGFATGIEPKLVVFASIQEPKGVYYASETAAPLFKNVLQAAASRFSLPAKTSDLPILSRPSSPPQNIENVAVEAGEEHPGSDQIQLSRAHPAPAAPHSLEWSGSTPEGKTLWKMPVLKGLTSIEVIKLMEKASSQLEVVGQGIVVQQHPPAGQVVGAGTTVRVTLSEP